MFGLNLLAVLAAATSITRDLDVTEVFAGAGRITQEARRLGLRAQAYDKARIPGVTDSGSDALTEDIVTKSGFERAVQLVLRLRVGGLLWLAPLCSSWVFYNVSRTKRCKSNEYRGDLTYEPVRVGNSMAEACVFLIRLARARGVQFAVENPKGSYLWLSCFFQGLQVMGLVCCCIERCAFDSEPLGQRIRKVYQVWGSGPWVKLMSTACSCGKANHQYLTESWVDAKGRKRTKGNKELLKKSQVYPPAMAELVLQSWAKKLSVPAVQGIPSLALGAAAQVQSPETQSCRMEGMHCQWQIPGVQAQSSQPSKKKNLASPSLSKAPKHARRQQAEKPTLCLGQKSNVGGDKQYAWLLPNPGVYS